MTFRYFALLPLLAALPALAQEAPAGAVPNHQNAQLALSFERVKFPAGDKAGMIGVNYLLEVAPNVYLGPAAYGTVTGRRGGFFTAGGEANWHWPLVSDLELVTGLYVGGGGGSPATVGGGLMLRPHVDVMWKLNGARFGVTASQVRFPNGFIRSNQIGVQLAADSTFSWYGAEHAGQTVQSDARSGVGIDRVRAIAGAYKPKKGLINTNGTPTAATIAYAGSRMERFLTPNLYWGVEASGAASGNQAGYAEFLGTLGAETALADDALTLGARLALGMGGGWLPVGGGQLAKVSGYASAHLSRDWFLSLEGGYATAPGGTFRASFGALSLGLDLDHPYAPGSQARVVENEWVMGSQHYLRAARQNGSKPSLDALTFRLNRYLGENVYLTGQAHSAYLGNAGGYSVGLLGAGVRVKNLPLGLTAGAELLAGAAGGGNVDSSGGAVVQPTVYLGLPLNADFGLRLSVGQMKSLKGKLNTPVIDLAATYNFGTAGR
jgi:hypothetical protein